MLDARTAVRNLGEVIDAQFLLFLEAEWAMIGRDDLQRIVRETLPEFFLMPFLSQRRREDILRALESGDVHVFQREIQILRASLGVGGQPAVARLANFFERLVAGEMNDVDRRAGHFRQRDCARSGFGFGGGGTRKRVIFRGALPFRQRLLDDHIDSPAIFGVHADQSGCFAACAMARKMRGVVEHEYAGIGHKKLETRHALADEAGPSLRVARRPDP